LKLLHTKHSSESLRAGLDPFVGQTLGTAALDHNFWTWNLSRSSNVSKDSDYSLVSI